jgi:hypothetical protein
MARVLSSPKKIVKLKRSSLFCPAVCEEEKKRKVCHLVVVLFVFVEADKSADFEELGHPDKLVQVFGFNLDLSRVLGLND